MSNIEKIIHRAKHRKGEKYDLYTFARSELEALLLAVQDEQKKECADKAGRDQRHFVLDAPYAYNPKTEGKL